MSHGPIDYFTCQFFVKQLADSRYLMFWFQNPANAALGILEYSGEKHMKEDILDYCIAIAIDLMLVQGAGGNVSWKDGDALWVKASGTCLADAARKDIFVPVDLPHLARALASGDFSVLPRLRSESALRPSIETLLHALMPHPVVVHLHAVEILAWLVRNNFRDDIMALIDSRRRWASTAYHKPGAALAKAVSTALGSANTADVVLLQNHGVVIGE